MINRSKDYIMSDQSPVIDGNSPLVLKPAAAVNKNIFADRDILSAVCIEGGNIPKETSTGFPVSFMKISLISSRE